MSDEGWYTGWGGLSFAEREALRELAEQRLERLFDQRVDARLVHTVWGPAPPRVAELLADPRDVGWLDELTLDDGRPEGSVPIASFGYRDEGVIARDGELYAWSPGFERPVAIDEVWSALLGAGLDVLAARLRADQPLPSVLLDEEGGFDRAGLLDELAALGGPALLDEGRRRLG